MINPEESKFLHLEIFPGVLYAVTHEAKAASASCKRIRRLPATASGTNFH
jgi:hypothetical protein